MAKSSVSALSKKEKIKADIIAERNKRNKNVVRWYLMIYPYGRKGIIQGLEREIARRKMTDEPQIEYFAPIYVEATEGEDGIVRTEKQLFYNYVFVRASENELFRMKRFEQQYNFARREQTDEGEQHYPYVTDTMIQNLKWIARSYSGVIPVYTGDSSWLIKGDRIRITAGPFKGVEAQIFSNKKNSRNEILVLVDQWMSVPLLNVKEGQYKVIALSGQSSDTSRVAVDDEHIVQMHDILCRHYSGTLAESDMSIVRRLVTLYADQEPASDVMRCKLYSVLLMAYTLLFDEDRRANLLGIINVILPAITAEQSKAQLLTTLYGCTDDNLYWQQAHQLVAPWKKETSLKKSKQLLITRLADYDRVLNH